MGSGRGRARRAQSTALQSQGASSLKNEVLALDDTIEMREHTIEKKLAELRLVCEHRNIVECPWQPEGIITKAQPERRLCLDCGIEEEGWGSGFHVLVTEQEEKVPQVSREELYEKRMPGNLALYDWCHGNRYHDAHPWPKNKMTEQGTRCPDAQEDYEAGKDGTPVPDRSSGWVSPRRLAKASKAKTTKKKGRKGESDSATELEKVAF